MAQVVVGVVSVVWLKLGSWGWIRINWVGHRWTIEIKEGNHRIKGPYLQFCVWLWGWGSRMRWDGSEVEMVHNRADYMREGEMGEEMMKVWVMFTDKWNCNMSVQPNGGTVMVFNRDMKLITKIYSQKWWKEGFQSHLQNHPKEITFLSKPNYLLCQ